MLPSNLGKVDDGASKMVHNSHGLVVLKEETEGIVIIVIYSSHLPAFQFI